MKSNQFFSGIALVGLAASVTAGSMYVSLSAASQQESPPEGADATTAEVVEEVARSINQPLTPEQVIHSRSHDVVLDASGAFSGRLSTFIAGSESTAAAGVTVKVIQDGLESGKANTDDQGNFSISGLKPGVAAMLAYGENGFLLYGISLVAADEAQPATNEIDVDSALVSGADLGIVMQLISSKLPKADVRFVGPASDDDKKFPYGIGDLATSVLRHRVQLQKDGRLRGVINLLDDRTGRVREVLDLSVYFVREGRIVGKAEVENNGEFVVAGLAPGIHSVVGVGKDGTFALGFEIVGADQNVAGTSSSQYRTVAVMASLDLSIAPANAGNFNSENSTDLTDGRVTPSTTPPGTPPSPAATGGTGTGGNTGAGGSDGGGFGVLEALLAGAAGVGVGLIAGESSAPVSP